MPSGKPATRGLSTTPGAVRQRRYRREHPEYEDRSRKRNQAYLAALRALARRHPAEFTALYRAELEYLEVT